MEILTESEYSRLTAEMWWQSITRTRTTGARRDIITWLLSTAQIKDQGKGGNIAFDDLVSTYTELEVRAAGAGLKLSRFQLEDTDGGGIDLAAAWSTDIGAYMSYWPQEQVANLLKTAHTAAVTGYDQKPFFATNHPVNPFKDSAGTYSNLLTGAGYAIDDTVQFEAAFQNLSKLYGQIASVKMPNGVTPRFLRPKAILCSPRMYPRVSLLLSAKYLPVAAGGGAGAADVDGYMNTLGFSQAIQAYELGGFENDTTYFVVLEQAATSRLGALIYTEREPFHINYYGVQTQAELDRRDELEWHCKGRNVVSPGHPYLLVKVKAS
jgi:hypothetical protein